MNVEELVRQALREQADGQPPAPAGFADRVLAARRRRRLRALASAAVATAAVVAVAVGVPPRDSGHHDDVRPARAVDDGGDRAHPDQSPPRELIAAGRTAMAAYYTQRIVPRSGKRAVVRRTYWLADRKTGRYEKDDRWSFVAVAPGLRTAAVLERTLPARRIGLLDLATGEVERWIPVAHAVAGLAFSCDGRRLVATTYSQSPDQVTEVTGEGAGGTGRGPWWGARVRTGFQVLDVASGQGAWRSVPPGPHDFNREDFAFGRAGNLVYSRLVGERDGMQQFYDLAGRKTDPPANERHLRSDVGARLSPDGRLAAWGLVAEPHGTSYSAIRDPLTGEEVARARGAQLLAWADDRRLIAWERDPHREEYRDRLVLVTVGGKDVVPLSGYRAPDAEYPTRAWIPVFAER
ncbi:WD40 repeat domain-containing protein [Streptomyces sp. SCL15-4]|uniref:WD40 repeat domain-containing protein n=1 Tax=Streptomyces sp. SCL15-4 TaxID=2967221 RepID=UPI0029664239|nr:WD40 repeat domain-containing protein [Streptomyces sp. SCL15-4]